jgi:rare lipoprotein A
MDLSHRAAEMLGYVNNGSAQVQVEYVGKAPLEGDDTRALLASYNGPPITGGTRYADGTNSLADMAGNFFGNLFSYSDTTPQAQDANIGTAFAAVNSMATKSPDLQDWAKSVDADSRTIKLGLGVFSDEANAIALSEQFAVIGSVLEEPVSVNGKPATRLTLTYLKPGVGREDAIALARKLGLNDINLY